ncbi:MAG: helix-turn-helix domain-containing protein [Prolixibacteraceae bacterium]|nr:helix-turn-helix domain-containing protein [Prolixibacteraceae bacterium]
MISYYTPIEVAKILKLNPNTVWRYIKQGHLSAFKIGRCYRISEAQVEKFLNQRLDKPGENTPLPVGKKGVSCSVSCSG